MNRINGILVALLALQVGVIAASRLVEDEQQGFARSMVVPDLVAEEVLGIEIVGPDGTVSLVRAAEGAPWTLGTEGWRADGDKVDRTLGEVLGLETADLVSAGADHHVDLEVADDTFQRKLTLTTAEGATEVVFGSAAPGSGIHLRRGGEEAVYAARDFSSWKLGTAETAWIDRTYLSVPRDRVVGVRIQGPQPVTLAKEGDAWTVALGDAPAVPAEQTAVDAIVGKFERLTLSEVVGTAAPSGPDALVVEADVAAAADEPARTVVLDLVPKATEAEDGEEPTAPERWLLRDRASSHTVDVARWAVRPWVEIEPSELVAASENEEAATETP